MAKAKSKALPKTVRPEHEQQSPFPFTTPAGAVIVDELCRCGALRSEHRDTISYGHGPRLGTPMAGTISVNGEIANAQIPTVLCERFTWMGHVFKMPPAHTRLDGSRSVVIERNGKHDMGGGGWRYQVYRLDRAAYAVKLFNTVAKVLSKPEALEHARKELQAWDERQASKE